MKLGVTNYHFKWIKGPGTVVLPLIKRYTKCFGDLTYNGNFILCITERRVEHMAVVQFVLQVYSVSFHTGKRTQLVVMVTSIVYTVVPLL